ncbi:MAG: type 1 glutamine amidotransferase [Candidatus Thermoplasmatota archaeon]|nr:type 1 glutamine amidotransferase [Candidatus Thermoplasmatota archaeon]
MPTTLHVLQHAPYEGPAHLGWWALTRGLRLARTQLHTGEALPSVEDLENLVILGGPMSVGDETTYPWLAAEKALIGEAIEEGLPVLGVCLGAQLIAEVLGGEVTRAEHREVGWHPVTLTGEAGKHRALQDLPSSFQALHWHGDTYELPTGATHLARSEACEQQAFAYQDHVLALQFHLEFAPGDVQRLAEACPQDLEPGPWVQGEDAMMEDPERYQAAQGHLETILDGWLGVERP